MPIIALPEVAIAQARAAALRTMRLLANSGLRQYHT